MKSTSPTLALLFVEATSLATIYEIVNRLSSEIQILDFGPCGAHAQILLQGPQGELAGLSDSLQKEPTLIDKALLQKRAQEIGQIYLSVEEGPLLQQLLVIESGSMAKTLRLAEDVLEAGWGVIELRKVRGFQGKCHLLASGEGSFVIPDWFDGTHRLLAPLNNSLRSLFALP